MLRVRGELSEYILTRVKRKERKYTQNEQSLIIHKMDKQNRLKTKVATRLGDIFRLIAAEQQLCCSNGSHRLLTRQLQPKVQGRLDDFSGPEDKFGPERIHSCAVH